MSATITFRAYHGRLHLPAQLGRMAVITAAVTLVLVFGFFVVESIQAYRVSTPSPTNVEISVAPRKQLPPEWQWSGRTVKYEHMYGNSQPREKLGWIRNGYSTSRSGPR
jgi:hypothetical protein